MRIEVAQRLLNGRWRHASAALQACQRGEWAEFVRRSAPARPTLAGRLDHPRCLALAERSLAGPVMAKLTLVPLWACSTEDASPRVDSPWECTVRRWTAATVVESRNCAPDIPLRLRAGAFGVLQARFEEVLSVDVRDAEPLPQPTREVPMFANGFQPRVRVPPELESRIQALGFTAEDEGD
ncbi:hypothetical protein [Corallococcus exercitus]|uniref:hypothetical protein n=1 Tax=Corallococcus exercitus TaxID=2316736 RepID=UPI0035D4FF81